MKKISTYFMYAVLILIFSNLLGCGAGYYRDGYKTVNGYKSAAGFTLFPRPETAKDIAEAEAITSRTHYMMAQQKNGNNLMYGVIENHKSSGGENKSSTVRFFLKTDYESNEEKARVVWSSTIPPGKVEFVYLPAGDYMVCVNGNCFEFSIDNIPYNQYFNGSYYDFYFNTKKP